MKEFFKKSNVFFCKHWILTTFILKVSAIWYSLIIGFFGEDWNLVINNNGSRQLTFWGGCFSVLIVIVTIFIAIVERYNDLFSDEKENAIQTVAEKVLLEKMNSQVIDICKSKFEIQLIAITNAKKNPMWIPSIYTEPCHQIETILNSFLECLISLISTSSHKFSKADFTINLFYNFPKENPDSWQQAQSLTSDGLPLARITGPGSTFSFLLQTNEPFVFFNSKKEAMYQNNYIKDRSDHLDKDKAPKGSIACYRMDFGNQSGTYIQSVICFATKKERIIDENSYYKRYKEKDKHKAEKDIKDAIDTLSSNIYDYLIENFKYRIGIELCNYYMQFLKNKAE